MAPLYPISNITNSTLNFTLSNTFSFQDALTLSNQDTINADFSPDFSPPFLFNNACLQDDGTQNCTASCQDLNAVFGSLDTLHNCMIYPTVADLYEKGNLTPSAVNLAEYYKIEKSTVGSGLYTNITTTIKNCLSDWCNKNPGCAEGLKNFNNNSLPYSPSNITSTFYIDDGNADNYGNEYEFDFCDYVPQSFNQDIGGIGVYISYWIQIGLALLSFILVVWWNWGIYYIYLGAFLLPYGYNKAQEVAQKIRSDSKNKHLPSLTGALAEFQKAQCFFMLAINIAALVNRNNGGLQPISLQQLYNTYILIKCVSISGYLPVTFTLFTLHLVDVVSWYLLILSIVTVLVSMTTLFVIGNFSPSQKNMNYLSQQAFGQEAQGRGPESCGTNNLLVYCYSPIGGAYDFDSTNPASGAYSILAFCLVVLMLLVAHQYHTFKDQSTGQLKPWLSRVLSAFFRECNLNLRRIQFGLALMSIGLTSYVMTIIRNNYEEYYESESWPTLDIPAFVMFVSCWTLLFVLYLFITSDTAFTRTDRPVGRFFNQKIAFATDSLSAIFWFTAFIALAFLYQGLGPFCEDEGEAACGTVFTNVIVGECVCITFVATTVLAARDMLRKRNRRSDKHTHRKQYWIVQWFNNHQLKRQLSKKVPSWRFFTGKLPSWKQTSRKLPSWIKHPLIIDTYIRFQQNTFPTIKISTRRAYQNMKTHVSTLDWPSTVTSIAVFLMYLIFFSLYIYWFKGFIQDLAWFAYNGIDGSSWSFGQVVAIMVWVEPLCEYFHLELRGMKRGFEHRLWGYKVVKIKQPDAERGLISKSTSSVRSPSQTLSLDDQDTSEHGDLEIVESTVEGASTQHGEEFDREEGESDKLVTGDPMMRQAPESREGSFILMTSQRQEIPLQRCLDHIPFTSSTS